MTPTQRVAARSIGWGLIFIGFALTFRTNHTMNVWSYSLGVDGPWSWAAINYCGSELALAAVVAVAGIVAIRIAKNAPDGGATDPKKPTGPVKRGL